MLEEPVVLKLEKGPIALLALGLLWALFKPSEEIITTCHGTHKRSMTLVRRREDN